MKMSLMQKKETHEDEFDEEDEDEEEEDRNAEQNQMALRLPILGE